MPCGLRKAPATFQAYIDNCLRPSADDFAVRYISNIPIDSINEEKHEEQVQTGLERLGEFGLYAKGEKCHFGVSDVGFLGFVISPDGIGKESDHISTIQNRPTLESIRDAQVLLGFTNIH